MKRLYIGLIALCAFTLCRAADTLRLDLGAVLDDYPQTEDGYWVETYADGVQIECPPFRFSHSGSADAGGGMSYWAGFTLCTSGDDSNYGTAGSSDGWVAHQWGCMSGGGLNGQGEAEAGAPYLVGYWGFMEEQLDESFHSLQVDFTDGKLHRPVSVYLCNHPWPYYGNINGDGFANAFSDEGDYFAIVVHGLNEHGEPTGVSVRHELTAFRGGALVQSDQWEEVDLRPLGSVSGIYFTMETSDADALYGANTATYFCMDKLCILADESAQSSLDRPTGLTADSIGEESVRLRWKRVDGAERYVLLCNQNSVAVTVDTCYAFKHLLPYTDYALSVIAVAGQDSSETATLNVRTADLTPPTAPSNLRAEAGAYSLKISWDASTDNVGVTRYTVYLDGEAYRRTAELGHTITGLAPNTTYLVEVEAADASGNRSERAGLFVSTSAQGVPYIYTDGAGMRVYTIEGAYIGDYLPREKGIYVIINNTIHKTIIIN